MKASQRGAFFVFVWFSACLLGGLSPLQASPRCPPDRLDESVGVAQVVDGDTLRLTDGRLVRLIGINTPEIGRDGRPGEPGAIEARNALERLLGSERRIGLRYGVERRDRHGRTLANAYLATGQSLEASLLSEGLGAMIVVPPNIWHEQCFAAVEAEARRNGKGVWSTIYRPIAVDKLPRALGGFRVIRGRIERLGQGRQTLWLNFERLPHEGLREGVALRIRRSELAYFTRWRPQDLVGKRIEVRGWLVPQKRQNVMSLRHPAALHILPHPPGKTGR